jgi:hypothetical protein
VSEVAPSIHFSEVPQAAHGGAKRLSTISGRVSIQRPGLRLVLYARSGVWWVQPYSNQPFTSIRNDLTWSSLTHLGTEYAALLVDDSYTPPKTMQELPNTGGGVVAAATVPGRGASGSPVPAHHTLTFSGYEWEILNTAGESGGVPEIKLPTNAWTDSRGWLHLRIAGSPGKWSSGEVALTRSLGYGSYSVQVQPLGDQEPSVVLSMFTWDPVEAGQNHREIDIELSQWGDRSSKNAQFAIQPYYVPANVFRFQAPSGAATHSFRWERGLVSFHSAAIGARTAAEHQFSSGIPSPGEERLHLALYLYGKSRTPQKAATEVVIEKFSYLP